MKNRDVGPIRNVFRFDILNRGLHLKNLRPNPWEGIVVSGTEGLANVKFSNEEDLPGNKSGK